MGNGKLMTHCLMFFIGKTLSTRWAAVSLILLAPQLGQKPRRLQLKATKCSNLQDSHYKFRKMIVPQKKAEPILSAASNADEEQEKQKSKTQRISWARLLKRVFNIDIEVCPKCRGKIKIIAAIEDPKVIKKILDHMNLPSVAPVLLPARGPPISDQGDLFAQEFYNE